jgi:hypothetical protein
MPAPRADEAFEKDAVVKALAATARVLERIAVAVFI